MDGAPGKRRRPRAGAARFPQQAAAVRARAASLFSLLGLALGTIFMIPRPWIGALLWGALVQNPRHTAFALLGLAIGDGIGRALHMDHTLQLGGGLKANSLLAAVSAAWLTGAADISLPVQVGIAAAAAIGAAIYGAAIMRALNGSGLPSLVWGYCLMAGMLFSLFPAWTALAAAAMDPWPLPIDAIGWGDTFLRSLGSLLYAPTLGAGLVVGIAILLWSRTMFFTGTVGWISGAATAVAFQNLGLDYYWPAAAYNFFLAGMALGSVFFLPGRASMLMAAVGGGGASFLAVVLQYVLHGSSVAFLPISAGLTIWVGIDALVRAGGKSVLWRNHALRLPPEEAWWRTAHWAQRFGIGEPLLVIPVAGLVQVAQGFNGALSHAGPWRHALDFQRPQTASDAADAERSMWGVPVTAPAPGYVERTKNDVPDNPLGISNFAENWGNHVVIRLDQGGWALLAHLRQGTIKATIGSRIETGNYLGEAGNSGRSPIPHLHLQAQIAPEPGAPTMPFRLANFQSADRPGEALLHWNAAAIPAEGAVVKAASPNPLVHNVLASIAPGSAVWVVESRGRIPTAFRQPPATSTVRINTTLDESGRHRFGSGTDGALIASLAPDAWRVIEPQKVTEPFLRLLGLAVPSVPYAATIGMTWDDAAPLVPSGPVGRLALSVWPYLSRPFPLVHCKCTSEPSANNPLLEIETNLATRRASLPYKVTCQFQLLRGPVRMQADFEDGTLVYSLLSFEPGPPFGEADRDEADRDEADDDDGSLEA